MADQPPLVFENIADFSCGNDSNLGRYSSLVAEFKNLYGDKPQYVVRAPGRVNMIGEHVDYSGYAVLPMAIAQDIACAFSFASSGSDIKISLANQDPMYQPNPATYSLHPNAVSIKGHHWFEYIMCGIKGLIDNNDLEKVSNITALFSGNVPPSAGLSSSSALVCCSALMTAVANAVSMSKVDFATMCASCENLIGTEGGGMDQAISFLAEPGTAKLVTFKQRPDTVGKIPKFKVSDSSNVPLPQGVSIVVANSLVKANKAAGTSFNERVAECRLATKVIAKLKGVADWRSLYTLGQVEEKLGVGLPNMPSLVDEVLHEHSYSIEEICSILEMNAETLVKDFLHATPDKTKFELFKRAKHCYTEAGRVWEFQRIATSNEMTPEATAKELGRLMSESHVSLRDLYQCSHVELDRLVEACIAAGAYGARLTGAGWGGCTIALIPSNIADAFIQKVKADYYNADDLLRSKADDAIFISQPGGGAAVLKV
jgi:N-acetylgalactosamine kinase